jgi:ParB family chromosome partitioning protein
VRETDRLVKRMLDSSTDRKPARKAPAGNADIRKLEVEVSDKLGAKVSVQHTQKGSGKLVITYNSLDELDGILKHIR